MQEQAKASVDQVSSLQQRLELQVTKLDTVQSDNMKLRVENQKLARRIDSIKNENQTIAAIEQEKDGLKHTVHQMKATIDMLQKSQTKQDELEVKAMSAGNENTKLQRRIDILNR